ncbi:hypothetical protein E0W68_11900 [Flavobacterium salilacus subsp. salilacus]|uniref:hypothetical protein n=1 Tax=Flavobacterium TaxID=237 RepID=UPI00107564A2|nr:MULTISPECIES: hypothetical protein [Flavobacterium]KAF2516912.1 hypothetical protein E0W68_11900 [Flavobacterium salilacus subsp. salilacus]MBE1615728.1 hypothetical protein [Flavobacterium sp. SaA2.13]
MKSKILISIKFALYIGGIIAIFFIIDPLYNAYHDLQKENERLKELNSFYKKLDEPEFSDSKNQSAIRENIVIYESFKTNIENDIDYSDRIPILILFLAFWYGILNTLDSKIEKLKTVTNDKGELL